MAAPQEEAQRLTAIGNSADLGRLADAVVLATIRWEQEGRIEDEDREALRMSSRLLEELASIIADPLDLAHSLDELDKLDLVGQFNQLTGGGLGTLMTVAAGQSRSSEAISDSIPEALLLIRDLLNSLVKGEISESDALLVRSVFESLSRTMLTYVNDMLMPTPGATWTTRSYS